MNFCDCLLVLSVNFYYPLHPSGQVRWPFFAYGFMIFFLQLEAELVEKRHLALVVETKYHGVEIIFCCVFALSFCCFLCCIAR